MADRSTSVCTGMPSGVNSIQQVRAKRTFPGWRLARLFETISGSMGMTRSGR